MNNKIASSDDFNQHLRAKATQFQIELLDTFPQLGAQHIFYITDETAAAVNQIGTRAKDCVVMVESFEDTLYRDYYRLEYCVKNCGLKCLRGEQYRKVTLDKTP